jgi:DNA-binding beta-propeller fold protein YncE
MHPSHAIVSSDNSLVYVSNFGADSVAVYNIDSGRLVTTVPVGSRPDALALSPNQHFLLVADSLAGDVAVILKRDKTTKANPAPFALHTMVPVGIQPNQIAVKAFISQVPAR